MRWIALPCVVVMVSGCAARQAPDPAATVSGASSRVAALADSDDEVSIAMEDLPEQVVVALEEAYPGCIFLEAEREGDRFEVDLSTADDRCVEAELTADGQIVRVEEADPEDCG